LIEMIVLFERYDGERLARDLPPASRSERSRQLPPDRAASSPPLDRHEADREQVGSS